MDFSKTKKKKKTKKKDLDEFIAEDEKKKAEDKDNGITLLLLLLCFLYALLNKIMDLLKKFENVILFSKHASLRLKGNQNLVRVLSFYCQSC
jgi:hypothetical protein